MSNFSNILRLYPEKTDGNIEHIEPDVTFPCPFCAGNGWRWNHSGREREKDLCTHCNGSGRLKAKIDIQWEPGGPTIPIFNH